MTDHPPAPTPPPEAPAEDPLVGRLINEKFRIKKLIARGGMGAVYRAEQAPLGRVCALKILKPNVEGDERFEFQRRFFLEASTASKLTHPNTVTIFDYGHTEDGVYFIAMEYLEGRTLHSAIKRDGPFSQDRALEIAKQVCRSLREAHALGVIHRDIKPANVYLVKHGDEEDFVKLLDFGLVKDTGADASEELTQAGLFMGSPKYMSPEQIQGGAVDGRTDIYALGVLLFEMLAGQVPFDRGTSVNTLIAHVNEAPPRIRDVNPSADVTDDVEAIVARCLAKNPADRFGSMEELVAAMKTGAPNLSFTRTGENASLALTSGSGPHVFVARGNSSQPTPISEAHAAQLAAAAASMAPPPKRSKAPLALVGLLAAAAAFGVWWKTRPQPADASVASARTADVSAPAAVPPPQSATAVPVLATTTAEPVREATLRVESDPAGATVRLGGESGEQVCNATPCTVTLRGPDAQPGHEVKLHVSVRGYAAQTVTARVGDDKVKAKLRSSGGGAAAQPPAAGDKPFRPNPYEFAPY